MNYPMSGGWRFGQTSNDALLTPSMGGIDPEFLKKVAQMSKQPQGLLDQALTAQPLTGLIDGGGQWEPGNDEHGSVGGTSGTTGIGIGNMSNARDAAALAAGAKSFMAAPGLLGLIGAGKNAMDVVNQTNNDVLGAVNSNADPIAALNAVQGWTTIDQAYMEKMRQQAGGLLGLGPDYDSFANDFGGPSAGAASGIGAGGVNNGGYGVAGGFRGDN